jgi:transposase
VVLGGYFATLAGMRKPYPTDLSDAEWKYIEPHLPAPKGHGRPRTHDLREILNAVFYLLKSGCQWRLLPHDFPRWPTVYWYFNPSCPLQALNGESQKEANDLQLEALRRNRMDLPRK